MLNEFVFNKTTRIGSITYVDTTEVIIEIENEALIPQIVIGNVVSIDTTRKHVKIVGIIEKVIRKYAKVNEEDEEEECSFKDIIKVYLIGTFKSAYRLHRNIFNRGIEIFPQLESGCHIINKENLEFFMNSLSKNKEIGLELGNFSIDKSAKAILDGDKFFQRHAAILGSTGSGKSWCVAKILEKASLLKYSNLIVLDIHGEYNSLCTEKNSIADTYKIAGPGDLNSDDKKILFLPSWILNKEELLSMVLDRSDLNAPNQNSRFIYHVRNLKEKTIEDKEDIKESFTVDSPIPFDFNELIELLIKDDTEKIGETDTKKGKNGDFTGKLTRFISRLKTKMEDKRYGFMFQPHEKCKEYEWIYELLEKLMISDGQKKGIKIIDFSEVPSDILPIVTGIIARIIFDLQLWMDDTKRTPLTLVCDEAHLYLPKKDETNSIEKKSLFNFERIAKEGRKYGISLLVISQRPSEVNTTILSQCGNFIVLRLTNDIDKNTVKNLLPDGLKIVIEQLPFLDIGEAIIIGDAILLPSRIKLEEPLIKPNSNTRKFWSDWNTLTSNEEKIKEAIERIRGQNKTIRI